MLARDRTHFATTVAVKGYGMCSLLPARSQRGVIQNGIAKAKGGVEVVILCPIVLCRAAVFVQVIHGDETFGKQLVPTYELVSVACGVGWPYRTIALGHRLRVNAGRRPTVSIERNVIGIDTRCPCRMQRKVARDGRREVVGGVAPVRVPVREDVAFPGGVRGPRGAGAGLDRLRRNLAVLISRVKHHLMGGHVPAGSQRDVSVHRFCKVVGGVRPVEVPARKGEAAAGRVGGLGCRVALADDLRLHRASPGGVEGHRAELGPHGHEPGICGNRRGEVELRPVGR